MFTFASTLPCTFLRDHGRYFVKNTLIKGVVSTDPLAWIIRRSGWVIRCPKSKRMSVSYLKQESNIKRMFICKWLSGSSFIARIHRFLRRSKTLSILTVPNLKIHKNTKIPFGKVLRGKNFPKKDVQRGRGFIWTRLWTQTYFRSSLVTFRWSDSKDDDRKYLIIGNYKITKIVRVLWLAERSVCMR